MSYVFDSSFLIYFGKLRLLEKISELWGKKYIPETVYSEVVSRGFERGEPEAAYINELVKRKLFFIGKPKTLLDKIPLLSQADMDVLSMAKETNSIAIIDEIYGSDAAEENNIESHGSLYMLFKMIEEKIITRSQAKEILDKLIKCGFYLSIILYKETLDKIDSMKL